LNEKDMKNAFDLGIADANDAIKRGPKVNFDDLIHYHALKKRGDK